MWDASGNLVRVQDGNGVTLAEYVYDHLGRRVKKLYFESGTLQREVLYEYAGLSLGVTKESERHSVGGQWTDWRTKREYLLAGGGAYQIAGLCLYTYTNDSDTSPDEILFFRYLYDHSLNVAAVLDENGEFARVDRDGDTSSEADFDAANSYICLFEYDAFGNNLYETNVFTTHAAMRKAWDEIFPHHLAAKEWDPEARLYYFGYRWYEPQQGAFISRSPLGPLAEETYAYCSNDPVNFIDPNGLFKEKVEDLWQFLNFFGDEVSKNWLDNLLAAGEGSVRFLSNGCIALYFTDQSRADLQISRDIGSKTTQLIDFLRTGGARNMLRGGLGAVSPGRLGGPAHRNKVAEIIADITLRHLFPDTEVGIPTVSGEKSKRFMDVVARDKPKGTIVEVHQVGDTLKSNPNVPIARERAALRDVRLSRILRYAKRIFHRK